MKKYKYIIAISFIGCVYGILIFSKRLYDYYSWAEERPTNYHTSRTQPDDTLKVIMIGDSWAAYHHNNDSILASMLQEKLHKPVSVISSGKVGAKTKSIYELMFDSISPIGTHRLIKRRPKYCIISAGINDAVAKMGPRNYCHHYCLIIRHLLSAGIKPIVLDMPNVDYKDVYKRESIIANIRHQITKWLTNAPMWSFEDYRKELEYKINQEGLQTNIIFISSMKWNPSGYKDTRNLYLKDHIHLDRKGYHVLDSCIASYICN